MSSQPVTLDFSTAQPIQEREVGQGVTLDFSTAQSVNTPSPAMNVDTATNSVKSGIHSKMLGTTPGYAYQNRDVIDKQLRDRGGDYDSGELEPGIVNDVKAGLEGSILGMAHREKLPDDVRDQGPVGKFVEGLSQMVADLPFYLAGGAAGAVAGSEVPVVGNVAGAAMGGFALPAAVRKAVVLGIRNGEVTGLGDLLHRAADVTMEATKGAAVGLVTDAAGGLPVGKMTGAASVAMKGLYQSAALTTAADLLEGHVPNLKDFAGNAALIIPLNLVTHGLPMKPGRAKQALMDVYEKDGTHPEQSADKLAAQPPVKPEQPEGLRAAIEFKGKGIVISNEGETHAQLSERSLVQKPLTMEALEADPARADEVLSNPTIQDQAVIDRAWRLKEEAIERGDDEAYEYKPLDTASPVSGTFYHGTKAPIKSVSELDPGSHGNEQALYGIGAYLTDNPKVARGYAKTKGTGTEGSVLKAQLEHANLLDIENPVTPEAHSVFEKMIQSVSGDDSPIPENLTGKDLFVRLQEAMEDQNYTSGDAFELLGNLTSELRDKGYDGLRHEGGTGNKPKHNVAIVFPDYGVGRPLSDIVQDAPKPLRIEDVYDRSLMKSGRGFVTPDGKYLSREQARSWVKENEPEVHDRWSEDAGGDKSEFHSEDYHEARQRVADQTLAEGEASYAGMDPEFAKFLSAEREGLNKIKAGNASVKYGESVLRTLFTGPRNALRAQGEQVAGRLRKLVPEARDQEALSFLRDYRDDPTALQSAIKEVRSGDNEKLKAFIPSMERAMNPSQEMLQADKELTDYFTKTLEMGRQMGTLSSTIDPSRYSPRLFAIAQDEAMNSRIGRPKFTEKTPHAIQREYIRLLDPLKSGDGVSARTFNALDELSIYADRHATAVATKLFTTELKNSELGIHGTEEEHPEGWNELRGSGGVYVPKVIADAMQPILESAPMTGAVNKFLHIQSVVKSFELGLSVFHMKALTITAMNNMSLNGYIEAMHSDNSSPEFEAAERNAALHGVTTSKTAPAYEAYRGLQKSSIPTGLDKLSDIPVIKQVDAAAKILTHDTFDVIQRKFKVTDFSAKEAAWVAKHPNATPDEYGAAMRGYAKEVNAAYGGLNWEVMGVSKAMQNVSRLFLLAPDWTFSNVANLKYAAEGGLKGTEAANASRMFFLKSFTTGIALTAAMSAMVGGRYDFDAKHFDQVYLGKDKDGKEMYANWFFAGAPKDAITLVKRTMKDGVLGGLAETVISKAAPVAGAFVGLAENKEYSGAPIYKKSDSAATKNVKQAEYLGGKVLPFTVVNLAQSVKKALSDPNHDYSYKDILEFISDTMGATPYHESEPRGSLKGSQPGMRRKKGYSILK